MIVKIKFIYIYIYIYIYTHALIFALNYLSKAFVKICACLADLSYSNLSDNAATCMSNMIRKIRKD